MTNPVWLVFVLMAILLWSTTSLLYKAGARDGNESHICLKYSVCVGMEYAIFALGCWIYLYWKEGKVYNPFTRRSAPRLLGALTDNVGMVFLQLCNGNECGFDRSDSCCLSVLAMIGDRLIMKEKVSAVQYVFLLGIVAGSIMVIADTVF